MSNSGDRTDRTLPTSALTIRLLTSMDRQSWDRLVRVTPEGCFMQSWAWANFKELEGYRTFRFGLFSQENLVGGCILYFYPHNSQANLLFAPGGPILPQGLEQAGMDLLLQEAENLAEKRGAIALRIEPLLPQKPDYLSNFVRAPVDVLPSETLAIDLRPNSAELLAAMKPKGRYNLRLSQRYGVTTQFSPDPQTIPLFYDLFWETAKRQNFFGEPYGFFINLCQTLFAEQMAEIGLAYWQEQLLAAMLIVYWGERATYLYGGRSLAHPQVMAPYQLHWTAIQRAKERGCKMYDFYGFTRDPNHGYAKFSRFKGQFGGVPITTIGAQDYFFYDRLASTIIHLFNHLAGEHV
ncbi:peptidoglycan bridge formation glycyltransferase FemA/FemB family protein [bacterium]|nr:peptidoglycan bridge formation glycyltransferase FemA/FemB family protein [bacterium]